TVSLSGRAHRAPPSPRPADRAGKSVAGGRGRGTITSGSASFPTTPENPTVATPRTCPECRARLDSSRPPLNGKIRCPDCGAIVASVRDDDSDDGVTSRPGRGGPAERGGRRPRRYGDDDDSPFVKKGGSSLAVPIVVGVTLGLLGLLLVGGGIAGVIWMRSSA